MRSIRRSWIRLLVTGATGFVGRHVAEVLAGEGAQLRLLVRSSSDPKRIAGLPGETVVGDLTRPETLPAAVAGCEGVVHVAADYRLWIPDPAVMLRANVDGTRALLRAAREAGVRRFVYTSSVATMGFKSDGTIVDEETPVGALDMVGHYKRSKFLAEQEAIAAAKGGQEVIILNPTTPIGPGDSKPTPTGRIIVDFLNRKFPAYVDTGLNLVDVGEVARMHARALTQGAPGRRYILGGENLTLKQILDRLGELSGLPSPTLRIPHAVASLYATFAEIGAKFTGREPRATREEVRMGRKKMWASSARAQQELGYTPLPVTDSLRRAVDWFRAHGYVRSR